MRDSSTQLLPRAMRVRNVCVQLLAQRTGLTVPTAAQLTEQPGSLSETWDWWCAECIRQPVIGERTAASRAPRRAVPLLLKVVVTGLLVVFALAVTASPAGS